MPFPAFVVFFFVSFVIAVAPYLAGELAFRHAAFLVFLMLAIIAVVVVAISSALAPLLA